MQEYPFQILTNEAEENAYFMGTVGVFIKKHAKIPITFSFSSNKKHTFVPTAKTSLQIPHFPCN